MQVDTEPVSEFISKGVLGQQQETLIGFARDRFLKPGGRLVPQRVDLCITPIEAEKAYTKVELPLPSTYELDLSRLQ